MVSANPEPLDEEPAAPRAQPKPRKRPKRKPRPIPALKQLTVRPSAPRPQSQPKSQAEIDLSHHKRRCSICHHPDRDAIEEAFLQWRNIRVIERQFKIDESAIYRHAHALKLFKQRNLSLRSALEFVIQRAEHVQPSAEGLVTNHAPTAGRQLSLAIRAMNCSAAAAAAAPASSRSAAPCSGRSSSTASAGSCCSSSSSTSSAQPLAPAAAPGPALAPLLLAPAAGPALPPPPAGAPPMPA